VDTSLAASGPLSIIPSLASQRDEFSRGAPIWPVFKKITILNVGDTDS